jgi:hypothetical protein
MGDKVRVTLEVDPEQGATIEPFAEKMSEPAELAADGVTTRVTGSNVGGTPDVDAGIDF